MPVYSLGERRLTCASDEYFIAPTASVVGSVSLGHLASVWFNCTLRGDNELITVGNRSNVQDGAVLHVDRGVPVVLGENVTIGHKVMLHGCTVGDGTLIGINSVVLNRARIGASCLVGANSLVTEGKEFPDGVMIMGTPARVVRELTAEEKAGMLRSAQTYVDHVTRYRRELKALS